MMKDGNHRAAHKLIIDLDKQQYGTSSGIQYCKRLTLKLFTHIETGFDQTVLKTPRAYDNHTPYCHRDIKP